jgi:PKD repeat protein
MITQYFKISLLICIIGYTTALSQNNPENRSAIKLNHLNDITFEINQDTIQINPGIIRLIEVTIAGCGIPDVTHTAEADLPDFMNFTDGGAEYNVINDEFTLTFYLEVEASAPDGFYSIRVSYRFFNGGLLVCTKHLDYVINTHPVAAPIADFTGSPTSGLKPLLVRFTDASSEQITSRTWDFGDGQSSTAVNPSHIYTDAGNYTVALTVTGPGGSSTKTRTDYITVTEPVQILYPPANLQASLAGEEVTLTWNPPSPTPGVTTFFKNIPSEIRKDSILLRQPPSPNKIKPIITTGFNNIPEIEPNNNPNQAQVLNVPSPVIVNGNVEVSDVGDYVVPLGINDDVEDLFLVTIQSAGLSVSLTGISSDLEIYLLQIDGPEVIDASSTVGIVDEFLDRPSLPAGSYYIGISIFDQAPIGPDASPYTLLVTGDIVGEIPGLQYYNVYRSSYPDAGTSGTIIGTSPRGSASYIDNIAGHCGENFYYLVTAVYDSGESEPSNEILVESTVNTPSALTLISPPDNAIIGSDTVHFLWQQCTIEINRYWFEIAADSAMTDPLIDSMLTAEDTSKTLSWLLNGHTYWWRVRAGNEAGWGAFSTKFKFTIMSTGIDIEEGIPTEFSLSQNYPNPFNPNTKIRYSIPVSQNPSKGETLVTLKVYDILGIEISVLVNEEKSPGVYEVNFNSDAYGLSSGVYFYQLKAGEYIQTKKMLLTK